MASLFYSLALVMAVWLLLALSSAADAQTCLSQTFVGKNYTNCVDLPYLGAYLHWSYDESNSSLSIAFIAAPSELDGWVAWAINPNGTGMIGSQAFIAYTFNGAVNIETSSIDSYASVVPSKLSFDFWDLGVNHSGGNYTIFATVKVPATAESVNQVWQVGPGVNQNGQILQHSLLTDNLRSKGVLKLTATGSPTSAPSSSSPSPPSTGSPNTSPPPSNGGQRTTTTASGFTGVYLLLATLLVAF